MPPGETVMLKKWVLMLSLLILAVRSLSAADHCFIATEDHHVLQEEGHCQVRHAPCSTFKIAISVMGYNEGILVDETHPVWPFKPGYPDWLEVWKQPQNPTTWIKNSCVWYSQVITQKLGMTKFQTYVAKLNYGNQDLSGDPGKNNGLTNAWLSSSLQISPEEQVVFLEKLLHDQLPVSPEAQAMTRKILFVEDLPEGWKLYGKTGTGNLVSSLGMRDPNHPIGWFVGWISKGSRSVVFAEYLEKDAPQEVPVSFEARAIAREKLLHWIESDSK